MARAVQFRFLAGLEPSNLIDLPWHSPLASWDHPSIVHRTRGQSRHVVRFVNDGSRTFALKEIDEQVAQKEYRLLREIRGAGLPVVEAVGVVTGREDAEGEPIEGVLVTRFLDYSLPFRYLFSIEEGEPLSAKLIDAAVVLLVRLHVEGFYWGDCSLSNLLFRRDAGALMAYLVDAETSVRRRPIPDGMREHELDVARENFAGGLMDLAAEGRLPAEFDVIHLINLLSERYTLLWHELTGVTEIDARERHLIDHRIRRLNEMGFDVDELVVERDPSGDRLRVIPALVEEGHHARELSRLTGLEVQENQARRLLNDIASYGAYLARVEDRAPTPPIAAARWIAEVYQPIVSQIPEELRGRLEPAELFHELLEHRYYLSEAAGYEVDNDTGLRSYLESVLRFRPAEQALFPDE
ncbi:MAG TPA: DUF4032 domain-containing protein [Actinomycetota bacterium]|jgi:hypothetical protein|nr:DUF4032 domain-containing protein [Actinomycetota bacterium]